MYEQIARNKRDSVLLVAIILAVLLTLGFAIGVAYWRYLHRAASACSASSASWRSSGA